MKTPIHLFLLLGLCFTPIFADEKKAKKPSKRVNPAMAPIEDVPDLPRVLLLGDSISIGYTVPTREALKGIANVHRAMGNCGPTTNGLAKLDSWLGDGKWDVIHFNWGLHDLKYLGPNGENLQDPTDPKNHQQVPPEAYEKNLRELVSRLQKTGATLIWCSTTPVAPETKGRLAGDSAKYNAIAAKIMDEHGIATNDLFSFAQARLAEIQLPKNVHFKGEGSAALGGHVAENIKKALEK